LKVLYEGRRGNVGEGVLTPYANALPFYGLKVLHFGYSNQWLLYVSLETITLTFVCMVQTSIQLHE
tara:strand:+ start:6866 stop:7063 length:198 start_codon:yes stop_codon:yes gene_type:complete